MSGHGVLGPKRHIDNTNPRPKAQRTLQRRGQKDRKGQAQDAHCEGASF